MKKAVHEKIDIKKIEDTENATEHCHNHHRQREKAVTNRLARAVGHLEKVKQMYDAGQDCTEVLIQLSAVIAALNNTGKIIIKDHLQHCIVDAIKSGDTESIESLNNAIDRFIK